MQPLGIFDSGLGGLTVVKEINKQIFHEDVIYLGDTARLPYGTKSARAIIEFSKQNAEFLNKFNIKALIIACNSASAHAYDFLKNKYNIPVINVIDPGAKKAVSITKNKCVGVIGTQATIQSSAYDRAIGQLDKDVKVFSHACPLFVPLIEEGWINTKVAYEVAKQYLAFFEDKDIDVLILGCTHYPLLKKVIQDVLGDKVMLVDSASTVVKELSHILSCTKINKAGDVKGQRKYFVSDYTENFLKISQSFLEEQVELDVGDVVL